MASFLGCFVVRDLCGNDCTPDYEQSLSFLCPGGVLGLMFVCLSSKRARHTNDHARDRRRPRLSCLRRSTLARACTPSQSTVNRPGDRLNFANLTSFLWSIRVQTMENCCRLVQKRRLFNSRKRFSATLVWGKQVNFMIQVWPEVWLYAEFKSRLKANSLENIMLTKLQAEKVSLRETNIWEKSVGLSLSA